MNTPARNTSQSVEKIRTNGILQLATIGVAYFAANKVALLFPDLEDILTAVWPAAGVGLAALLLSQRRIWPRILVVIFISGNAANLFSGRPLFNSLCFMTANCLESFGSAWLITRLCGDSIRFNRVREILALVCAATIVNAGTASLISVFAVKAGIGAFKPFWITWWVSDGLGLLIITPAIVAWYAAALTPKQVRFGNIAENVCFTVLAVVSTYACFHADFNTPVLGEFPYVLLAVLSWGAMRANLATISTALVFMAVIAVTGDNVSNGLSFWGGDTSHERMLLVQFFIGVITSVELFLAASLAESRHAAKTLQVSEERFRTLIEQAPEAIVVFDVDQGRLVAANSAAERLFGCSHDELLQSGPQQFYGEKQPDGRPVEESMADHNQRALAGEAVQIERNIRTADGRNQLCQVHLVRLPSENGRLIRGSFLDVTERRQLELFRDTNIKLMEVLLSASSSIDALYKIVSMLQADLGFDAVGIRLQVGDNFPYLVEVGFPKELLAKENSLTVRNSEGEVCRDEYGNVCLAGTCGLVLSGKIDPKYPLCTPTGSFWTNDSCQLLHLLPGQDVRLYPRNECIQHQYASFALIPIRTNDAIIGLLQLNDHRKNRFTYDIVVKLENMAAHIGERIMRDIADDEKKLLQSQLVQAQKMEAVGQLAGGVAHDFNNILTVIAGYCGLLQFDDSLKEKQQEYVAEIASSAQKAAQLTYGLLAFSRKQSLVMKHEDLNDIVQHVHTFLARIIGEDITLTISCCGQELHVIVDRGQIEQALINLATNARDAMRNGGVISVGSELTIVDSAFTDFQKTDIPPGKYALLTVSDTGTGISKEHLDHIFEPFFTTKEVGKGTGLGMAIIYGIIKQHNGFITVYSEPGHGTTFRIYLPIQETSDNLLIEKTEAMPLKGSNETILVAEDEPSVRTLVSKILTNYGYEVILAEDGEDAIEKFRLHQDSIRLILMDMIMPKKNGKEANEELQLIKPGVKVLFFSGYTADFIENRGISEEGIELLMKPVQPTELLRKVRQMLDA